MQSNQQKNSYVKNNTNKSQVIIHKYMTRPGVIIIIIIIIIILLL